MVAVVSVSQGVMGSLQEKLSLLATNEYARMKGSRSKIAFLISELNNMYALHQKVTMMEDPDVQVKAWAREVRELAYDIEDCIDKFMHSLGIKRKRRKTGGIRELFHTCVSFLHTLRSWHQIASKIDELKTRVVAVREQRNSYKLDDLASGTCSENIVVDPRLCALFAEGACLVGIEGPRDDLVNWLVHGETGLIKHCKVLSIVGFGGLGKTTLANEVYRKIRANFHCHAFVSLSQKPDMKKILKGVLFQLLLEDSFTEVAQTLDEMDLILKLRELLQDKRYSKLLNFFSLFLSCNTDEPLFFSKKLCVPTVSC